jgi:hypothetical protein
MVTYKNASGVSNVASFEYTFDSITVKFKDGTHYIYSTLKNNLEVIEKLKRLADQGFGLNSVLASKDHPAYDQKWK